MSARSKVSGVKAILISKRDKEEEVTTTIVKEMKLLHCKDCDDIVRIYSEWRACKCGKSKARYINDTHAQLTGPCRALGIDTGELYKNYKGTWHESDRVIRKVGV